MIKIRILLILILFYSSDKLRAQLLIPEFEEVVAVDRLNSEAEESNLFPYADGKKLYYYRTFFKEKGDEIQILRQNIWFSELEEGEWDKPDRLFRMDEYPGEIMIIGSSMDGKKVYLTQTTYDQQSDAFNTQLAHVEQKSNGEWTKIQYFKIPGLEIGERFAHIFLSADENVLLLSISANAEKIEEDLYVSIKDSSGNWSPMKDLGPTINTSRAELSPFLAPDHRTLFFSTEAHGGYGGTDVYASYRLDDSWSNWTRPKNLGNKVNSREYEEHFVMLDEKSFLFTSDKGESADIYYSRADGSLGINKGKALAYEGDQLYSGELLIKEEGDIYQEVKADASASFEYMIKSDPEKVQFEMKEKEAQNDLFLYLLDENDQKVERKLIKADGSMANDSAQRVVANLKCDDKASVDTELRLKDQNNFKLAVLKSDREGIIDFYTYKEDRILLYELATSNCELKDLRLFVNDELRGVLAEIPGKIDKSKFKTATKSPAKSEEHFDTTKAAKQDSLLYFFDFNAISLSEQEEARLIRLARSLQDEADLNFRLIGFTDSLGGESINYNIGAARAFYVKQVLVREGIDSKRIKTESKGESTPEAPNDEEKGRALNRRVQLTIN